MTEKKKKPGRFSEYEDKFLRENYQKMTEDQMADELNREYKTVRKRMAKLGLTRDERGELVPDVEFELESRKYYETIMEQFTKAEREHFKDQWIRTISQFNNDVLHTEEMQIVDMIKSDILMQRCLTEQALNMEMIEQCRARLNELGQILNPNEDQQMERGEMMDRIAVCYGARDAAGKQYVIHQKEKNQLIDKLKGARTDRFKNIQNSKETYNTWLSRLINDKGARKRIGEFMERYRLSAMDEKIKLAAYHKYEDGEIDQVYLSHETVKDDHTC